MKKEQSLGRAVVKAPNATTLKNVQEWEKDEENRKNISDSKKKGLGFNPFVEALHNKE